MFFRMIRGAFTRQWKKMLMIALTVALGASLATAMLGVMMDVGDKVNQKLKTYGANITVVPKASSVLNNLYEVEGGESGETAYLREDELGKIKTIFWAFNIVDFSPFIDTDVSLPSGNDAKLVGTWFNHHLALPTGEELDTGVKNLRTWWVLNEGVWLDEQAETDTNAVMVGAVAAQREGVRVGDTLHVTGDHGSAELRVVGIFDSGDDADEELYAPLNVVQVSIADYELWYCTAYVSSICYQLQEVITDSVASPVRQVADSEGAILEKTELLMVLITILSLIGSALGITNLVTASVMERSNELGLLKAIGAKDGAISALVLTEIILTGIVGAGIGYLAGLGFAQIIGRTVFGSAIAMKPLVLPVVAVLVLAVTLAGSVPAIRMLLKLRPAEVLHGR